MGAIITNKTFFSFREDKEITDSKISEILSKNTERIQVGFYNQKLTSFGWKLLNDTVFKQKPDIRLRIYDSGISETDLSFLQYLPNLRNLSIESGFIKNIEPLVALKELNKLSLYIRNQTSFDFFHSLKSPIEKLQLGTDENKNAKVDISAITNFKNLKSLSIERYNKNLTEIIPHFTQLEELSLKSVSKIKTIDFISQQKSLLKLQLSACGINNYEPLTSMNQLRALILYKPAKLETLDILSQMTGLQYIYLQTVNTPTTFPDIARLTKLRRVILYAIKSIRNFQTFENTNSVKEFCFYETQTQHPTDFIPILKNQQIEKVNIFSLKLSYKEEMNKLMAQYGRKQESINFLNDADFVYEGI